MPKIDRNYLKIALLTTLSVFIFWSLFYFKIPQLLGFPDSTINTIFKNYDGPNYLIISKCWYSKTCIASNFSLALPLEYYPAHLPFYPLLISIFDTFLPGPTAMLLVTLLGSLFLNLVFYQLLLTLKFTSKKAYYLTLLFNFLPPRLFILRNIGAPETWFIGLLLLSIMAFLNSSFSVSALSLSLAQVTKTPAVLLLVVYFFIFVKSFLSQKNKWQVFKNYSWYLLVPMSLLAVFYLYYLKTGDFWAYFNSGDNRHLNLLPFGVFISNRSWVYSIWLEDIIYIFSLCLLALTKLNKKYRSSPIYLFPLIFTLSVSLVVHRDLSRYITPVYPFIFIAFSKFFQSKSFKYLFPFIVFMTILYSLNFVIGNTAPVADWTPYL